MKHVKLKALCLFSFASLGCAGALDGGEDFFANHVSPIEDAGVKKPVLAGWHDAGRPPTSTPASASSPVASADDAGSDRTASDAEGGMPQNPAPAAACDFRGLLQSKCGSAGCHGAPATSTGLDLTSPMLAMRVQGRKGTGACTDKLLVDPAHPDQSKLYLKISSTSCGVRMPLGGTPLTSAEQACVLSWIDAL
jgi:hypothetical protein